MARPRRPRPAGVLALFVLVLVAATAWIGVRAVHAQRHLSAARVDLAAAREALLERDLEGARDAIEAAGDRTQRARALTSDPLWRLSGALPGYGDTAYTVTGLARAADELANDVLPQALDGAEVLDPDRLRGPDGAVDIGLLRAATPPLVASADAAERVQDDVQALPQDTVAAVADARGGLAEQVVELAQALRGGSNALQIAPALLGEDRPRRYLALVQQTAESRGTGGLFGGYVELVADAGRLTAVSSGSNRDLRNFPIPVPDDVPDDFAEIYGPFGAFAIWQNVNLSPDLPVVADVVQARWVAQGGEPLDGVITLDGAALAAVLAGSGPIGLPDGRQLSPEQLPEHLAVDQYRGVPLTAGGALGRKDQLEGVAVLVAARLTAGGGDSLSLFRGLADAVRSGHLQMASDDPLLRTPLALAGVDGALPPGNEPMAYPVVYNSTGGKLDHFLDREVRYSAGGCDGERRSSTVSVTLTNQAPPVDELPPYLTIRVTPEGQQVSSTNYLTLLVYGTRGAELDAATLDGTPLAVSDGTEGGLPFWSTLVELPPGRPRTVELQLTEPTATGVASVPEQPLARALTSSVDVPTCD